MKIYSVLSDTEVDEWMDRHSIPIVCQLEVLVASIHKNIFLKL